MSVRLLYPRPPPMTITWQEALASAGSEREVLSLARDFVAHFDYFDLNRLPSTCRPPSKIVDGSDVTSYAFDLLRHQCTQQGDSNADVLEKLADFFSQASVRLSQVAVFGNKQSNNGDERESA
jgi:hypothetical protein